MPRLLITFFAFFILNSQLFIAFDCHADTTWQAIGPFGGIARGIAIDPSNSQTIFVGAYNIGIFKTTNGGASWTRSEIPGAGTTLVFAFDPNNSQTLYAAGGGIFKSTDGGATWIQAKAGISGSASDSASTIVIHPTNSQTVYVGTDSDGIYKTTNGGVSWVAVNNGITNKFIKILSIDPNNSEAIYVGTNAGAFKTSDGGVSWAAINMGMTGQSVTSIVIDPTNSQTVYVGTNAGAFKSTNGGVSWASANSGISGQSINTLAINQSNSQTIYAGTNDGVFKSNNGGGSWADANNGLMSKTIYTLAIDPTNSLTIYAETFRGVYKSINGGASWVAVNSGMTNVEVHAIAIDPTNSQIIYAYAPLAGLVKSTNGGASWTSANNGISDYYINTLSIDQSNSQTIYAATNCGLFKSTNGGGSWSLAGNGFYYGDRTLLCVPVKSLAIDPSNSQIVYAGIDGYGVLKSTTGGALWTAINNGITNLKLASVAIDPSNSLTLYVGTSGGGIFKSINGGASWGSVNNGITVQTIQAPINTIAIDTTNSNTIYAGVSFNLLCQTGKEGMLFKSTDGGATWVAVGFDMFRTCNVLSLAIDPNNSQTVYAALDGYVVKSSDGGISWIASTNYTDGNSFYGLALDPGNSQIIYSGTWQGVYKTLLSDDIPLIIGATTATLVEGVSGTFRVASSGWPAPQFSLSGPLPSGVSFNTTTGTLSGTPASGTAGIYPLLITAANGIPPDAVRGFTLTVLPTTSLAVSIATPVSGTRPTSLTTITGKASGTNLSKVEVQITDGIYYPQTNGSISSNPTWMTATGTTSWSLNTSIVRWREGITYTVYARASNGSTTSAPVSSTFTIPVPTTKTSTALSLTLTPDTIRAGGNITINWRLVKADTSPVSGQTVNLHITPPSTAATPNPSPVVSSYNTGSSGALTIGNFSSFTTPGVYLIQARFEGTSTLAASYASQALGVTPSSGYTIIVSGKATDNSLLDMHNNSTDSIYSTMLNKRGFLSGNINYLKSTTSRAVTKQQIQDAIIVWAKGKLVAAPAPLYLIMIDHGTESGFVIGDQIVTPDDLSGWLNTLETDPAVASSGVLTNYKRFVIIGSCYSGTFISKLSKTGRVIITSAGADEQSLAGFSIYNSGSNTTFSGGEYFIDNMINFLGRGDSFKDAVTQSSTNVALRDPRKLEPGNHSGVYDTLAQHPLLDDTGTSNASYLPASSTNGTESANLTFGVGIKTLGNPADITAVTDTTFIQPTQTGDTPLWLSVNDNSRIAKAWMEIRTPITAVDSSGSSGQVIPRLILKPLYYDGLQWNGSYTFPNAGTYKVLYYTQDNQTNDIAPAKNSTVYKQLSSNIEPPPFTLTSPNDQGAVSGIFPLTWQTVTSTNSITYTLLVATDQNFTNEIYKEENIPQATTYIPNAKLMNSSGQYYCQNGDSYCYWKVTAIDNFGATTESNTRSFTIISTNALPAMVKGYVRDNVTGVPVTAATVTIGTATPRPVLPNGYFLIAANAGATTLTVKATNYTDKIVNLTLTPGAVSDNSINLTSTLPTVCTQEYAPVCGTDGKTYSNSCYAAGSGVSIAYQGECTSSADSTPPTLTLSSLANGATTNNATLNVAGTVSDAGGVKSLTINGQPVPVTGGAFSFPIPLTAGTNTITTIATDNANNTTTDTRTITLDRTAPVMTITLPADNSTTNKNYIELAGTVDDQNATVTAKVNGGTNTTAAKNGTNFSATLNLASGQNTIDVTATDPAGNSTNAKRTVTSDTTSPTLNITNPVQDTSTALTSITITGTVTDAVTSATISITYEGMTYTPAVTNNSFSQTINLTTDKTYAITVTATDQANNKATAQRNIIKLPKTKIFLGADDIFSISSSGTTLYGNTGSNSVTITTGTTGVTLDQNIGRINLPSTPASYKFKQTGNIINVYDTTDTLIVSAPVQGDTDGTLLSFSNGTLTALAKLTSGTMTLGGQPVTATPTTLNLTATNTTPPSPTTTKAKVYLGTDNSFTVSSSGTTLYGSNTGTGIVIINSGTTNITLDQNIGQINLPNASSSYKFKQTGNMINVYETDGTTLIAKAPVQGDGDGTVLGFSNGTVPVSVKLIGGVMKLGGAMVSSDSASVLTP